jgi:membrane-bound serine protease (ClpP class)
MSSTEIVGIGLLGLSALLFLLEIKAPGFGLLGAGGLLALVAGLVALFGFSWATLPLLVALTLPLAALMIFMAVLAHRARRIKVVTGNAGMIGLEGRAETDLLPEGKVMVRGELWDAWSPVRLKRGAPVRVTGVRGLKLEVSGGEIGHAAPRSIVAGDEDD